MPRPAVFTLDEPHPETSRPPRPGAFLDLPGPRDTTCAAFRRYRRIFDAQAVAVDRHPDPRAGGPRASAPGPGGAARAAPPPEAPLRRPDQGRAAAVAGGGDVKDLELPFPERSTPELEAEL